jgi:uncharacterized membrane protein YfcA
MIVAVLATIVYGGYFGAAAGVLLLALLLAVTSEPLARSNAMKNLLLGLANAVAAVAFVAFGPVRWSAMIPFAGGFLVGGRLGPIIVRKTPAAPLRALIAFAGVTLAVHVPLRPHDEYPCNGSRGSRLVVVAERRGQLIAGGDAQFAVRAG